MIKSGQSQSRLEIESSCWDSLATVSQTQSVTVGVGLGMSVKIWQHFGIYLVILDSPYFKWKIP